MNGFLAALVMIAGLIGGLFWLFMLVDAASKEKKDADKIVWVLIILFASFFGAVIYFLYRIPKRREEEYLSWLRKEYSK